jgi:hypothetical protein
VSDWKQSEHHFAVTIPGNTTATVELPGQKVVTIGSGRHVYTVR